MKKLAERGAAEKLKLVLSLVWSISPAYFFMLIVNSLAYSGQILGNVIFPKYLINELMGGREPTRLLLFAALIIGNNFIFAFLKMIMKRFLGVRGEYVQNGIERAFADKIMSVEYRYLEDPHYLDLKERATFAMQNQGVVSNLIENAVNSLNQLFTVVGLVAIMLNLSWILVLALFATVGITLAIYGAFSKYEQQFYRDLIPVNRKYGYYIELLFDEKLHKDARLYNMGGMLGDTVTGYNHEINRWFGRFYRKIGLYMGLFQAVIVLQTTFAYGFIGAQNIMNPAAVGIGDLTMYVTAAVSFSSAVITLGTSLVSTFQMLGYLDPFVELMKTPDEVSETGTEVLDGVHSIAFENVSFTYPKSDVKILDGISFEIHQGEKISIVGLNGAGKSTIVKLLCRLYRPDSGKILINGRDIYEYSHTSFLAGIAAVFQDFKLFNFSIEENISCQPVGADSEKVERIISNVGMSEKINSLPHGIETLFGKEYDTEGVEFSGGQSQKIAIARALYKNASLVVLDEPTSALDPIAEAEIYANFNDMVGEKTAIYISHRMSSSVFCDRILVLNGGHIEAYAPHRKLMENTDGLYYKLFTSQAENYRLTGSEEKAEV